MTTKNYALISGLIFTLVALAHAWRIYSGAEVTFAGSHVSVDVSWIGGVVATILAIWGLRIALR